MDPRVVCGAHQKQVVFRIVLRFRIRVNVVNLKGPSAVSVTTIAAPAACPGRHQRDYIVRNWRPLDPQLNLIDFVARVVRQKLLTTQGSKLCQGVFSVSNLLYQIAA